MNPEYEIVAIGGGPAGIAVAIEWIETGGKASDVLVLEKGEVPIDAIRKFYPDKKMTIANYKGLPTQTLGHLSTFPDLTKAETLVYFDDLIKKYGLQIRYNAEVFKILRKDDVFEIWFGREKTTARAVAIGIGILGRPNKPDYKIPNTLRSHILYDLTSQPVKNFKVLVVGGGDTSSEYCQVLVEDANTVTLAYRGNQFTRMMEQNLRAIENLEKTSQVSIRLGCEIKEVQDDSGKPSVVFADEERFPKESFDKVLYAIGGTTPINFLKTAGIECDAQLPKYGPDGDTNIPGMYLVGDLVCGKTGGSIITAYNSAFKTITHLREKYLKK